MTFLPKPERNGIWFCAWAARPSNRVASLTVSHGARRKPAPQFRDAFRYGWAGPLELDVDALATELLLLTAAPWVRPNHIQ